MEKRIIEFIGLLRNAGIRVSIAESIESCKALTALNISEKNQFKIALSSTLVKRQSDMELFDKIFNLYFSEPVEKENEEISEQEFEDLINEMNNKMDNEEFNNINDSETNKNSGRDEYNETENRESSEADGLSDKISENIDSNSSDSDSSNSSDLDNKKSEQNSQENSQSTTQSNSIESKMNSNINNFDIKEEIKDLYKQGSESDLREKAKQLANSRNFEKWELDDIDNTCDRLMIKNNMEYCKALAKKESRKSMHDEIDNKYNILKKFLKEEIEKSMVKQFGNQIISDLVDYENLYDKDLGELTLDQLERIQELIKRLAKKLSTHVSRKEKSAKHGKLDINKTIKKSIQNGSTISELQFKNKKKTKSELVVLCDISGSVWMYVQFMLQLVVGIQNVFDKVESYIFVDRIKNVTDKILNSDNMENTVSNFLDLSLGYGTDYGNVFKTFVKEDIFNKKTILIIIGDGENTGDTIGSEYLSNISDLCKVVFWLNPKDKDEVNCFSEMEEYSKYCKEVYECSTLRQLEDFIKKLIKI